MKKISFYLLTIFSIGSLIGFNSCKNDPIETDIDWELYEMAQSTSGFNWYKNSSVPLAKSAGSGHSNPKLRTRYNDIASSYLDSNGKVMDSILFRDGSLVVKELLDGNDNLQRYAILYKDSDNQYADANGWVWGYIDANGDVAVSATEKGAACIGCHSQSGNIDYGLMNKEFP